MCTEDLIMIIFNNLWKLTYAFKMNGKRDLYNYF